MTWLLSEYLEDELKNLLFLWLGSNFKNSCVKNISLDKNSHGISTKRVYSRTATVEFEDGQRIFLTVYYQLYPTWSIHLKTPSPSYGIKNMKVMLKEGAVD